MKIMNLRSTWLTVLLLCSFVNWSVWEKTDFFYTLLANENLCFEELFTQDIGVHSVILCDTKMVSVRIFDPENRQVYYRERESILDTSFTAQQPGFYKFWILNYARTYTKVEVNIRSGVDAKNYDSLITAKKIKPVELQAQKIEDMSNELKKIFSYANMREHKLYGEVNVSGKVIWVTGVISIVSMIVATFINVLVLRFYFNKKKKM